MLLKCVASTIYQLPIPRDVKCFLKVAIGVDAKIKKPLLLPKVKRSSCFCFCATRELSYLHVYYSHSMQMVLSFVCNFLLKLYDRKNGLAIVHSEFKKGELR